MLHTRHAYLTKNLVLYMIDDQRRLYRRGCDYAPIHVTDMWEIAQRYNITHVWLEEGSIPEYLGYGWYEPREGWNIFVPQADSEGRPDKPRSGRVWKKGEGGGPNRALHIAYPQQPTPWDWQVEHPLDCLAAIDYLEQALELPVQWSPSHMGGVYLNRLYDDTASQKDYLRKPSTDLRALPFKRACKDVTWKTPHLDEGLVGDWLHVYDKNSAHPCAAGTMLCGIGDPVHVEAAEATYPLTTGIYRIDADPAYSIFDGKRLPFALETLWANAVQINFARKQGWHVQVHEGWIYTQKKQLFSEWSRDLWAVRQLLQDTEAFIHAVGRENAQATIKEIMNFTMPTLRDDWYGGMVAAAATAILANMGKFAGVGHYPKMIYYDEIAYATSDPDPRTAVPGIMDRERQLGGYKHKYSIRLTRGIIDDINSMPSSKSGMMQKYVKKVAEKEGIAV